VTAAEIQELLPLHALDLLEGDEAAAVERAIASDAGLAKELAQLRDAAHSIVDEPIAPPADIERHSMASVGLGRYERFVARFVELFDLAIDPVRELLGRMERAWPAPEAPGVSLIHFEAGPACATADCGIVRVEAGGAFPWHTHLGEEHSLILSGRLRDNEGREFGPGDEYVAANGTSHDLIALGDEPVIFVARAFNGIQVGRRPQS
jgi:quercetin dioxygenase-like cupin family protein